MVFGGGYFYLHVHEINIVMYLRCFSSSFIVNLPDPTCSNEPIAGNYCVFELKKTLKAITF